MQVRRVYETVLYADDVAAAVEFYSGVLGFRAVEGPDDFSAALRLPDGGVLLLFEPSRSSAPGRPVPSHGARGPGHVAFAVEPGTLPSWSDRLAAAGVERERELDWPRGGRSLYVRDPAGNSVELVDGDIWPA